MQDIRPEFVVIIASILVQIGVFVGTMRTNASRAKAAREVDRLARVSERMDDRRSARIAAEETQRLVKGVERGLQAVHLRIGDVQTNVSEMQIAYARLDPDLGDRVGELEIKHARLDERVTSAARHARRVLPLPED
jgi:uncharacterized protein YceH (UPF0502 family)